MFTAQPHTRWAPRRLVAPLLLTCLFLLSVDAVAGAHPSRRHVRDHTAAVSWAHKRTDRRQGRAKHRPAGPPATPNPPSAPSPIVAPSGPLLTPPETTPVEPPATTPTEPPAPPPAEPPAPPPVEPPAEPPSGTGEGSGVIIGVNNISGWGPEQGAKMLATGITSERLEYGDFTTIQQSLTNGFRNDTVIVGNTPDGSRLSTINTSSWVSSTLAAVKEEAANGVTLLEVGNEMYLKGGQAEPVKYAEMYMALADAVDAANVKGVKLLFNSFGDYQRTDGTFSNVPEGGGWLADALRAQPRLKTRVDAFSAHPYGLARENNENTNDWGPGALEAEHRQAVELGFSHTDYYATEFGVQLDAGGVTGSNSEAEQAERIKAVFEELIATGYVKGIWYYGPHDNETGKWGLVTDPWTPRKSLAVVASFAASMAG
jgi:hypothetical protein